MAENIKKTQQLGTPRQIRFPRDIERGLQEIADANDIEWTDAVRMAARRGLPILRRKLGLALKEAA